LSAFLFPIIVLHIRPPHCPNNTNVNSLNIIKTQIFCRPSY